MSNSPYVDFAKQAIIPTPQSRPIPGREAEMAPNNAGGYGFTLGDGEQLMRFLILGSEGNTYYVSQAKLTELNAQAAIRCIKADGVRAVKLAFDVNVNNRAPKTDSQLFVIALALKHGDQDTKNHAAVCVQDMLRTGTHLLHFVAMIDSLGGWNRMKRKIVAEWYTRRSADDAAFQILKYRQRDEWSQRDVLRLAHPIPPSIQHNALFQWAVGKGFATEVQHNMLPDLIQAHGYMSRMVTTGELSVTPQASPKQAALFGIEQRIPREALPTEALSDPDVWRALLSSTPLHALLRNLGNLTENGVAATDTAQIVQKLTNKEGLRRSRVHPFAVLLATLVYKQGHGVRGSKTWTPIRSVLDALEEAYDLSFGSVVPTNKRILIGIDISGSMTAPCIGTPIQASTAASAMAITLARSEPNAVVVRFDTAVRGIVPITKRTGIASLESTTGGGTDLSAIVRWASGDVSDGGSVFWRQNVRQAPVHRDPLPCDAFILLTDNETWAGKIHTTQALANYRKAVGPNAKLVCCAMAANNVSVVDPQDPLQFGCAGLDANLPSLVSDFIGRSA